jgi:putative peptidoglycan lipid II flippase
MVSRVLGLFREQLRAIYLGTGASSDAFGLAVMLPNLFRRLLGEGQMTAAFLPSLVERIRKDEKKAVRQFFSDFLGIFTFIVTLVVLIGILLTPDLIDTFFADGFARDQAARNLTVRLTTIMFPYLGLVTVAAILQAALQAHNLFWPSAVTPILLNICIIGCAILFKDSFADPAYAFAVGFLVGGFIQLFFQVPYVIKKGFSVRPRVGWKNPHVRKVLRIFVPGILAGGIYQIQVFVSQVIASGLDGEGYISALQYSVRLQELVLGVFVVSITTVILPTLSAQISDEGDLSDSAAKTLSFSGNLLALVTLPATVGLILLGPAIIRLLFQYGEFGVESADLVYWALIFHAAGLFPIALSRNVMQAFYAQKDLKTPMLVAAFVLVVHIVLCIVLSGPMDHGGIALSGSIGAFLTVGILIFVLQRRGFRIVTGAVLSSLFRCFLASGVLFAVVWFSVDLMSLNDPQQSRLLLGLGVAGTIVVSTISYVAALLILKHPEATSAIGAVRRKLGYSKAD